MRLPQIGFERTIRASRYLPETREKSSGAKMRANLRRMSEAISVQTRPEKPGSTAISLASILDSMPRKHRRLFDARHLGEGLPGMTLYRRAEPPPEASAYNVAPPISVRRCVTGEAIAAQEDRGGTRAAG
jgi:hypothetical protein